VLLLDRSAFPRDKLCGGALTHKSMLLLERVFGESPQSLQAAGAVDTLARDYSIRHMYEELISGRLEYPLHFAKRAAFDNRLLEHALQAGAEGEFGEWAATCDPETGVLATRSGRTYQGRFIIGADGAASIVRRAMPRFRERWRSRMATGLETVIAADCFKRVPSVPILHFGFVDHGYAWVFPTNRGVVTGLCGLNSHNNNFLCCLKRYLEFLGVAEDVKPQAHILPYGNYLERPVQDRALLAGDAAGYADCLLGEGLYYAMRSGEAAAHAILKALNGEEDIAKEYPRKLKTDVLDEIKATERWRKLLFGYQRNMRPSWPVRPLLRMFGDQLAAMVQGERSFRWGRRRDIRVPA
jgi:flavin-dependent dehydrogenase